MANTRILKRNKLLGKKLLSQVGKSIGIGAILGATAIGGINMRMNAIRERAEKERQVESQKEMQKLERQRRYLENLIKDDMSEEDREGMIKAAIKRGMLPRYYTRKDGTPVIVDYIDPPSEEGVKRAKPVETIQAELMRRELGIKKKKN